MPNEGDLRSIVCNDGSWMLSFRIATESWIVVVSSGRRKDGINGLWCHSDVLSFLIHQTKFPAFRFHRHERNRHDQSWFENSLFRNIFCPRFGCFTPLSFFRESKHILHSVALDTFCSPFPYIFQTLHPSWQLAVVTTPYPRYIQEIPKRKRYIPVFQTTTQLLSQSQQRILR